MTINPIAKIHNISKIILSSKFQETLNQVKPGDSIEGIYNDKKDTESWMHQADPSLTVHDLPVDPQTAFRKNTRTNSEGIEENDVRFLFI